jgi:hypothetical protein
MFRFIRKIFASLARTDVSADKVPYMRTPAYMAEVEDNLDRYFGLKIERPNPHIPELRADQFMRDVTATKNARTVNRRRIESNTDSLR